jgi:thioredoxin-related protein
VDLVAQKLEAIVFMSPTCPICKSITKELSAIDAEFPDSIVSIAAYFPSKGVTDKTLQQFGLKYKLKFALLRDTGFTLAKKFKASVTPEVFLIDRSTNQIVYRGMVDDSFSSVGKRRTIVKNHYLREAITETINGKLPTIAETNPVGCILQYP